MDINNFLTPNILYTVQHYYLYQELMLRLFLRQRMRLYKELRFCTICKKRFVVKQGRSRSYYCPECIKKYYTNKEEEQKK